MEPTKLTILAIYTSLRKFISDFKLYIYGIYREKNENLLNDCFFDIYHMVSRIVKIKLLNYAS